MRHILTTAIVFVALSAFGGAAALAQATPQSKPAAPKASKQATAVDHNATGVVTSINDTTLVIKPSRGNGRAMTFLLSPSTQRDSAIAIGSAVAVRYHEDGKTMVAMAITARTPQQAARPTTPTKKPS